MGLVLTEAQSLVDFSTIDISAVQPTVVAAITATLAVSITIIVIKKGYGIFKRGLRGA